MMKIVHLTDTHLVAEGLKLYGLDPRARLDAAVADINRHHGDAEVVVITGDLTHWGEPEAYASLVDSLAPLHPPVIPLLGNHDDRAAFQIAFPGALEDAGGFVQGRRETAAGTLLFLDTNQPGTAAGWYCEERLAWLERELAALPSPAFIFMHHPPFDVGIAEMDRIGLTQAAAFRAVIEPHAGKIRHLFYGHVHRPICGSWLGIPTSTLRGTNHQVWLDFAAGDESLSFSYEEPAYAVVLVDETRVVIHSHDYLYDRGTYAARIGASAEKERAYALGFDAAAE